MTVETLRRTRTGLEFVSSRIIEPTGIPFNPDGFIDILVDAILRDIANGTLQTDSEGNVIREEDGTESQPDLKEANKEHSGRHYTTLTELRG